MENKNKNTNGKPADDFIRFQDLWGMFRPQWHWFVISLVLTLSVALLYILSSPNIYTRSASILVKDDSKGGSASSALSNEFSDLGMFKNKTNINNELFTISSPTLMTEVVKRLGLNEVYTTRRGLKTVELYREAPVMVVLEDRTVPVAFKIELKSDREYVLSDFTLKGEDVYGVVTGVYGDSVMTPVGAVRVGLTKFYEEEEYSGDVIGFRYGTVDGVTDYYTKNLRAELANEDATIINLSIDDASIEKSEDILNTLIEVYNEKWIQDKNQIAVSTSQFIGERLGVIENELGHVDENISSYKSEHLLPDVQAASSMFMTQSAENKKELLALNNQLSTVQYIRQELNNKDMEQPLPNSSGIGSTTIESQIGEYNQMVLERNRLISNSSEKNPLVKDLASALKSMQQTIIQSIDNHIVALNTQIESIRRQEASTTKQLASNPSQAKYLLSVERQQKVKEQLYLYLLQKREENELSQAFTAYNTRVITAPRGSAFPTSPKKLNILLVAFVLGLLIPAVVIFVIENMNTRVRGRKDLENLSVPLIGEIPLYTKGEKKKISMVKQPETKAIVVQEGSRNVINEAFRVLRTNLDFMISKDPSQKVLVVTSFNPGSGKSFLTMNMAISFAIKRKRVLVIDGDLRHGSTSMYVDSPRKGLSDYLCNSVKEVHELIVTDKKFDNLHILPIGTIPPNPTELLEDGNFGVLIDELRAEYDYIFVDCPPIDIVADTQIVEKFADRTIFVVRAGLLDRSLLSELETIYVEKRFKNLSMILNGTERTKGRYSYRYGYHYGSYYDNSNRGG